MARPPRLELPGVPQHVVQRGNNRGGCFFGDAERRFYLKCLGESAVRRGCAVHAYVLMSNHVHLLISPHEQGSIGAMLQDLGRRYVRVINNLHGRSGTLWEGRFRSSLIDSERYFLACHRYIELNPVRAGLVEEPAAYAWSSHRHYVGDQRNPLITEHAAYRTLGATDAERRATFHSLFAASLEDGLLTEIRHAINTDSAFGSSAFMDDVEAKLGRSVRPPVRGRPRKVVTGKLL